MKNKMLKVLSVVLILCISTSCLTGCYGKFELTKKLHRWNGQVGDKWVNSVVTWVLFIVPAYEVAGFVDLFVLNVMEFWTGEKPLAMEPGEKEVQLVEIDGKVYEITATMNRFDIVQRNADADGRKASLVYEAETQSWYIEGETSGRQQIARVDEQANVLTLIHPDGQTTEVSMGL